MYFIIKWSIVSRLLEAEEVIGRRIDSSSRKDYEMNSSFQRCLLLLLPTCPMLNLSCALNILVYTMTEAALGEQSVDESQCHRTRLPLLTACYVFFFTSYPALGDLEGAHRSFCQALKCFSWCCCLTVQGGGKVRKKGRISYEGITSQDLGLSQGQVLPCGMSGTGERKVMF